MSHDDARARLAIFQARFGEALRAPLDRATGTLRARVERYDRALVESVSGADRRFASGRLAVYNRQYWFRLLTLLQNEYPLTARLFGMWHFNDHAARFLRARPPRAFDMLLAARGFDDFLAAQLAEGVAVEADGACALPSEAVCEAARLDAAYARVFCAPAEPVWRPSAALSARLPALRLRRARAFAVVHTHWPLVPLRHEVLEDAGGEGALALPPRLPARASWALVRVPGGIVELPLAPRHAALLMLLDAHPLGQAMALLEDGCTPEERASLASDVRSWLTEGMRLRFWVGADEP